jgi:hypothetical protein
MITMIVGREKSNNGLKNPTMVSTILTVDSCLLLSNVSNTPSQ